MDKTIFQICHHVVHLLGFCILYLRDTSQNEKPSFFLYSDVQLEKCTKRTTIPILQDVEMPIELALLNKNNLGVIFLLSSGRTLDRFAAVFSYILHTGKISSTFRRIFCTIHQAYLSNNTNYNILHFRYGQLNKNYKSTILIFYHDANS